LDLAPLVDPNSWCERRESNPHALRRWNLNPVRLPIPPLSRRIGHFNRDVRPILSAARASVGFSETQPGPEPRLSRGARVAPCTSNSHPGDARRPLRKLSSRIRSCCPNACAGRSKPSTALRAAQTTLPTRATPVPMQSDSQALAAYNRRTRRASNAASPSSSKDSVFAPTGRCYRTNGTADPATSRPARRLRAGRGARNATPTPPNCSTTAAARPTRSAACCSAPTRSTTPPENLKQSDAICSALQLINHWQDVAIDWRRTRRHTARRRLDLGALRRDEAHLANQPLRRRLPRLDETPPDDARA
jgi:hypothetical protein